MTEPTPQEDGPKATLRFGDLKRLIGDAVQAAIGDKQETQDPSPTDKSPRRVVARETPNRRTIDDEVSAALEKLEKEKEQRRKEDERDAAILELREKTKERPPREYSKRHKLMGWGE